MSVSRTVDPERMRRQVERLLDPQPVTSASPVWPAGFEPLDLADAAAALGSMMSPRAVVDRLLRSGRMTFEPGFTSDGQLAEISLVRRP
jgi:hypothetical protein